LSDRLKMLPRAIVAARRVLFPLALALAPPAALAFPFEAADTVHNKRYQRLIRLPRYAAVRA
jgi:hypothetical protein